MHSNSSRCVCRMNVRRYFYATNRTSFLSCLLPSRTPCYSFFVSKLTPFRSPFYFTPPATWVAAAAAVWQRCSKELLLLSSYTLLLLSNHGVLRWRCRGSSRPGPSLPRHFPLKRGHTSSSLHFSNTNTYHYSTWTFLLLDILVLFIVKSGDIVWDFKSHSNWTPESTNKLFSFLNS